VTPWPKAKPMVKATRMVMRMASATPLVMQMEWAKPKATPMAREMPKAMRTETAQVMEWAKPKASDPDLATHRHPNPGELRAESSRHERFLNQW